MCPVGGSDYGGIERMEGLEERSSIEGLDYARGYVFGGGYKGDLFH